MHKTAKKICVNILMENQDYHFVLLQDISMNYLFIIALFEGIDTWATLVIGISELSTPVEILLEFWDVEKPKK